MSGKRKFSESFSTDTDVVHSLMKYRATSSLVPVPRPVPQAPAPDVSQHQLKSILDNFVSVYEALDTCTNPCKKPNFSYTELIFLGIMRSPNFCLPISEIYRYIETRFAFFKHTKKEHWKNAIRHSLSKTKCFTKIGLENQKPRNGVLNRSAFLWTVMPKSLLNFARGDYRPANKMAGTNGLRTSFQQMNSMGLWEGCVTTLSSRIEAFRDILNSSPSPARIFQLQVCHVGGTEEKPIDPISTDMTLLQIPFTSPVSTQSHERIHRQPVLSPDNTSAINHVGIFCDLTTDPVSPNSETGSESFYSSSLSDSSGYDTIGELSSPEQNQNNHCLRVISPFSDDYYPAIYDKHAQELHELSPFAVVNIPEIPELPPLNGDATYLGERGISLPCDVDSVVETEYIFSQPCRFQSADTTDTQPEISMSEEDRFILEEFLSF